MRKLKEYAEDIYRLCGCFVGTLILILCVALVLGIAFGVLCLEGWVFMLLWNWLAVELFGASTLGYWVCVGIVFALSFIGRLLFGRPNSNSKE